MGKAYALLLLELVVYAAGMLLLFRARARFGLGLFFTALGSLHFLETYLAANLYVQLAEGFVLSPGSVILFSGKLLFVLLVYVREDAQVAHQPIYGLLAGNLLTALLVLLVAQHLPAPIPGGAPADQRLLDQMGLLMIWGSVLLFIDCLLVIVVYEALVRVPRLPLELRLWIAAASVLVFDQVGFFAALHVFYGVPIEAGYAGLAGKVVASALYALMIGVYLRCFDTPADLHDSHREPSLGVLFGTLTYRQRYEALRQATRRDAVTRLLNRGEFDTLSRELLEQATRQRQPMSLMLFDIDRFKSINDLHGHQTGDRVLRDVAAVLGESVRTTDHAFRFGGDELAVILPGVSHDGALAFAERLRREVRTLTIGDTDVVVTVSIGVASVRAGQSHGGIAELVRVADAMLYQSKADGRDRVSGEVLRDV
ncbi:diguanylate cyclase [Dokdonella sp. MW10]|uniref:GGDEF domain-containing protein n=1 Tax=Dokdonella sp. MW10 TaxID=2992926 RepID=UPI003F7FEC42